MSNSMNHHLYKRGNCWYIEIVLPKRIGGKRIRQSLSTGDVAHARGIRDEYIMPILAKASAVDALEKIAKSITTLEGQVTGEMKSLKTTIKGIDRVKIQDAFERYKKHLQHSALREATITEYHQTINDFILSAGNREIFELSKSDAIKWRDEMQKQISPQRIGFKFQRVRSFFKWCVSEGLAKSGIVDELSIALPKGKTEHTIAIDEKDADSAMLCKDGWTLAPRIARYTGIRLRAILRLNRASIVDIHGIKCFHVDKQSKTGRERFVPISEKLLPYINDLSELAKTVRQFNNYNNKLKKINPQYKFHCWRSYVISQMTKAGVDPVVRMRVVGHSGGGALQIHSDYTTVDVEQMKKAVDVIK